MKASYKLIMKDGTSHTAGQRFDPIECFRCGICCIRYRPKVTNDEIKLIARRLGLPPQLFASRYVGLAANSRVYVLQNRSNKCPFFSRDIETGKGKCDIYDFRPAACRNWLASLSNPECREGLTRSKTRSAILLPGELYSSPEELQKFCSSLRSD
jgi:Fe-S-cluster containining protein